MFSTRGMESGAIAGTPTPRTADCRDGPGATWKLSPTGELITVNDPDDLSASCYFGPQPSEAVYL
jgi:hypothetical protein